MLVAAAVVGVVSVFVGDEGNGTVVDVAMVVGRVLVVGAVVARLVDVAGRVVKAVVVLRPVVLRPVD